MRCHSPFPNPETPNPPLLIYLLRPPKEGALSMSLQNFLFLPFASLHLFRGKNIFLSYQSNLPLYAFKCILCQIFQNHTPLSTTHPNPTPLSIPMRYLVSLCPLISSTYKYAHSLLMLQKPSLDMRSSQNTALFSTACLSKE